MAQRKDTLNRKLELLDQLRQSRAQMSAGKAAVQQSIQKPLSIVKLPKTLANKFNHTVSSLIGDSSGKAENASLPQGIVWKSFAGALILGLVFGRRKKSRKKHSDQTEIKKSRSLVASIVIGFVKPLAKTFLIKLAKDFAVQKGLPSMVSKYEIGRSE